MIKKDYYIRYRYCTMFVMKSKIVIKLKICHKVENNSVKFLKSNYAAIVKFELVASIFLIAIRKYSPRSLIETHGTV